MSAKSIAPNAGALFPKFAIGVSISLLALPGVAHSQSVNYAELQDMFGEPVTTSVTGKPQRASEAPAALVIITRDDIRRSSARDIPGLIQAYAGIDVVRWTAGQADMSIRGGVQPFDPRLLVLVNGRQVYLDHYGMTNWAGLGVQIDEIQQIEIVRGPNSALFGFNAVSGVINIITVDPLQTQQVVTTLEAGTQGNLRLSQSAAIKLGDGVGLRLSGGYEKFDELEALKTSILAPEVGPGTLKPAHKEARGEIYAKFDARTEAGLSATYSNSRRLEVTPVLLTVPSYYNFYSVGAHISHDTGWGIFSAHALHNWSNINIPLYGVSDGLKFHNRVFVATTDALLRAGTTNTIRIGVEYRRNQLTSAPGYPGATHYEVYAASGMWEHQLSSIITLTVAARLDHLALEQQGVVDQPTIFTKADFNRSISAWSFNSALLFKLNDARTLRVAVSRGIQAPSLFSFGGRLNIPNPGTVNPVIISGNPAIEPARITSAEIGLIQTFAPLGSRLELTAFYNRTTDVISLGVEQTPPRAAPPAYPFVLATSDNVGTFTAYGVAASLSGRIGPSWLWALSYNWTKVDQHIAGNTGGQFQRPLALDSATPQHKIEAQLSYERGAWLATAATRYTSAVQQLVAISPATNGPLTLVAIDDSLAIDAKLAFKVSDALTIAIMGENLSDSGAIDLSPVSAERRLRASLQVRF